jgi:hypothetical protein
MVVSENGRRIDENGAVDRNGAVDWNRMVDRSRTINYNRRIEDEGSVVDGGGIETDRRTGRWSTVGLEVEKVQARKGGYRTVGIDVDVFSPLGEICARVCDSSRASQWAMKKSTAGRII